MQHVMGRTRWLWLAGATLLLAAGCSDGDEAVPLLVDYSHDEFATQFIAYFPDTIQAHPGDTIAFRQTWTGEPHTVTLGTAVDEAIGVTQPLIDEWGTTPEEQIPPEVMESFMAAESTLPPAADWESEDWDGRMNQVVGQPCLVQDGPLPDTMDPCEVRELPTFDGTAAWFNSGIIPYEGTAGNVFDLQLADTIEPGTYSFYCAFHGPFQSGTIEVVPADRDIPTPREVSVATREEVSEQIEPLRAWFEEARDEGQVTVDGKVFTGPFAGLPGTPEQPGGGMVNEFMPRDITTTVGEPVTWRLFGPHTISFDVPEYFPIAEFDDDGTVRYNLDVEAPAGGAPDLPPEEELEQESVELDGGTWDGSGFWSSGLMWSEGNIEYSLRFSTPGTYTYACLIHPPMIGTVVVSG